MSSTKRTQRTQRVGINLTAEQNRQLQQAAERMNQTPTRYAYELVVCALENPVLQPVIYPQTCPSWEDKLSELYGIFDVLTQDLDSQFELIESQSKEAALQPFLQEVSQQVVQAQATLLSIRSLLAQEQR